MSLMQLNIVVIAKKKHFMMASSIYQDFRDEIITSYMNRDLVAKIEFHATSKCM